MSDKDIVRAWKDEDFRASLGENTFPGNPAGQIELTDGLLSEAQGGLRPITNYDDCGGITISFMNACCTIACTLGC